MVRSVMRRTLSIRPSRSIAGMAHNSPTESGVTLWNDSTYRSTFSRSTRASVCEMSEMAISYTRGYPVIGPVASSGSSR